MIATGWIAGHPIFWTVLTSALCLIIGATNIYYSEVTRKNSDLRRSQEEVERLAAVAERERIARDLHDLLGHTLTLITLKSELARRLAERGDSRAASEIAEVEKISRDALAQVREAVTGFRDIGLAGEMARARSALEAAGIELEIADFDPEKAGIELEMEARSEATLALVLREAVTNVVRHSRASRCRIRLERTSTRLVLTVEDDGRGGRPRRPGQGLDNMRHRLGSLGGHLEIDGGEGFAVRAFLPASRLSEKAETAEPRVAVLGRAIEGTAP